MSADSGRRPVHAALLAFGLLVHVLFQVLPAKTAVWDTGNGRDFASYYYAYKVADHGGDPYDNAQLDRMASSEHTRPTVQPYFYPPPFLATMAWVPAFKLPIAYRGMLVLNELALASCLVVLWAGFSVPMGAIGVLLAIWSPIPDNLKMGQANLLALLPALLGLWTARIDRRWAPWVGGVLLGTAAMFKMSPALFLLYWAMRREWKPVLAAIGTAVGLSLASLVLVPLTTQIEFYTVVLPGFARGDYHGLSIPISLSANHSIPDIFNTWWPGPSKTALSGKALLASRIVTVVLLTWWFARSAVLVRSTVASEPVGVARALGALTILMVTLPTYTYEHHLVFLLLPVATLIALVFERAPAAFASGASTPSRVWVFSSVIAIFFVAWPLDVLNATMHAVPTALAPLVRESKFMGLIAMFFLLL